MARHFAQHCPIATTDNEHMIRIAMGQKRHVGHHFVIDKFVTLGGLHDAVQRHDTAKCAVLENDQILMIGLFVIQHIINGKVLSKLVVQRFLPHFCFGHWQLPLSLTFREKWRNMIANILRRCTVNISSTKGGFACQFEQAVQTDLSGTGGRDYFT